MQTIRTKKFQSLLLDWFDQFGRKNLPWQINKNPYRVWVSEIMLQQTQVNTVIQYYDRFITCFPTIFELAYANEDQVLHLWTGLGYYSRARNLHRAAKWIVANHQGIFPDDLSSLQTLPGIGRSTAGAILAIAFQKKAAILDANVKRVFARIFNCSEIDTLWNIAEKFTPQKRIDDYTQAIMDFGATFCNRSTPKCCQCPFAKNCLANKLGIQKNLPETRAKKTIPERKTTLLILQHQDYVLLEKRPAPGIWGGLWCFPESQNPEHIEDDCFRRFQCTWNDIRLGQAFRHTFSHYHLDITPAYFSIPSIPQKIMDSEHQIWYNLRNPQTIGLPQPIKKLLIEMTSCA